jgi:hypothetical protein
VFTAKGAHDGGDALFCVNELSRIAMEVRSGYTGPHTTASAW